MTTRERPEQVIGQIVWTDLTVPDAEPIRDFYADVVGWDPVTHPMPATEDGEEAYDDYVMQTAPGPGGGDAVSGICYARSSNAEIPAQWLVYVRVADLDESMAKANSRGGRSSTGRSPWAMASWRSCAIPQARCLGFGRIDTGSRLLVGRSSQRFL